MTTARASRTIDPAQPGSAAVMFKSNPGRKHPAEIVLAALLRGRTVDLPDGHAYVIDSGLAPCRIAGVRAGNGPTPDLPLRDFLRLCTELSYNDLFLIGCDNALAADAEERKRERDRLATQGADSVLTAS